MKHTFTLLLFLFACCSALFAEFADDNVVQKPVKKHHFNWLVESQPIIAVGKYASHQTISGSLARVFRFTTDSTYKFVNTLYMGSFKGSVGYQYEQLFYVGLGSGVQFGRQIGLDSNKIVSDIMVPFFADLRVMYGKKIQLYYQQTTGYVLYFNEYFKQNDTLYFNNLQYEGAYRNNKPWGGFFMQSSIGVKFNLKKLSVSAGLGYQLTYVVEKYTDFVSFYPGIPVILTFPSETKDLRHSILFTLGLSF